jgi:hypothetical protein
MIQIAHRKPSFCGGFFPLAGLIWFDWAASQN